MRLRNSDSQFGIVAIALHWFIALFIFMLLGIGLYMVDLPVSLQKLKIYGLHKEFGLLVLFLVLFRFIWRMANQLPELNLPWIEKIAARSMHLAFYFLMIAMPLSGWLMTSSAGLPVSFFGWFTLPDLVAANEEHRIEFALIHKWLGYGLIIAIGLHTAAALKHHFINKDNILRRMLKCD